MGRRYNKKLRASFYTGLDYGMGLYRGYITEVKYQYTTPRGHLVTKKTLIGNACNIASRIESYSHFQEYQNSDLQRFKKFKGCRLITTEGTLRKLNKKLRLSC